MRIALMVIAIAAVSLFDLRASRAYDGPWCAQYSIGTGSSVINCSMQSFAMCHQEIIGGNRGFCFANPRWRGNSGDGVRPRAHRKRSYN
jgi:hypothetical protein